MSNIRATGQMKADMVRRSSLADHIRSAAKDSGLSVYQIAKQTGIDQSGLNRFINGTRENIRLDVADRLFRFFDLRVVTRRTTKKSLRA